MKDRIIKFLSSFIIGSTNRKRFRSFSKKINLFEYFYCKKYYSKLNYKIISLGQNCLPRIITSRARLKPYKLYGELTCPFDLNFYLKIDDIIAILDNKFKDYFDELVYNETEKTYMNERSTIVYFHDGHLTKEQFKKTYIRRINNFFHYMSLDKHLFFILATLPSEKISIEQILRLKNSIQKLRGEKSFSLIVINLNLENDLAVKDENIFVINQEFILSGAWAEELETEKGIIFYNNIVEPMKNFIENYEAKPIKVC